MIRINKLSTLDVQVNIYSSYILADQVKTLKPCDENRRRKWKVVYMYGTVALRSPIPTF